MSRLRKVDRAVLRDLLEEDDDDESYRDISFLPIGTEEQEDMIHKFELRNSEKNDNYLQILTLVYLFFCGIFIVLTTRVQRTELEVTSCKRIMLFSIQSIAYSLINLRYEFIHDFFRSHRFKIGVTFSNKGLNILNLVMLILLTWIVLNQVASGLLKIFFHVPHVLFIISIVVKRWMSAVDLELYQLRSLHHKFKSA